MAKRKNKAAAKTKNGWSVERPSAACVDIRVSSFRRRKDWRFSVLLTTDRHWDNPKSDWEMQRRHLSEAAERGAPVVDNGDFFCLMQGKFDKRASKSDLRPEHQASNYLDAVVNTGVDFFAPYAKQFAVIGEGNHETAISKRHETNITDRFVGALNSKTGASVQKCGYGSWVRFFFEDGVSKYVVKMKRFHGSGGGGPVTKGTISTNRRATYLPDADIIFTGHVHEEWTLTTMQERLTGSGEVRQRRQTHVCGATYKEEYQQGLGGWHVERGAPPKPVGAVWLNFTFRPMTKSNPAQVVFDTELAR